MWLEDGRRAGAAISLTGNTDINKVDINNMDIDLDDIFSVPVSKPAPTVSKFRPNANRPVLRKGSCAPANAKRGNLKSLDPAATVNNVQNVAVSDPVDAHPHEEGVSQSLNDIHKQENILEFQGPPLLSNMSLDIPIQDPFESSSFGVTDDTQSENFPDFTVVQESETFEEDAILIGGDSQINKETIVREVEAEVFPGLSTIESFPDSMATSSIGQHRGKFIPKKIKGGSKKPDSSSQHSEAKEDHLPDVMVNSEAAFSNEGPTPSSVSEGVFDYSSLMLDESTPDVQFSQPPQSESFEDCLEPSRFNAFISKEAAAGVDTDVLGNSNCKNANRDAAVQDSFQNCKNAAAHNDVAQYSDGIAGEANVNATGEETLSPMKKGPRKSKTTRTKSEKTTKKRKNGDDTVPEQPSEEQETPKKKKFSHSTQRRKRCVDKVLLQTPEEDIDYQKLRMKDLIFLAEHKEKLAKKAKMPKTSSGSASTQKSVDGDDSYNKEFTVTPEENESLDQETNNVEQIITLFNYQSFMNKAPTAKWSKQDTELFYEGIKQFGTDLGMIKELFPDLTRHQVKLKYKKEERQNPLRLSEALYGRAKDHRHFEMVIQRLQAANKTETESHADDSAAVTGDGDCEGGEEVSNGEANNQEEATSVPEKDEKKESKDEVDHGNFETPQESQDQHEDEEEEIDEDFFSSYKNEY